MQSAYIHLFMQFSVYFFMQSGKNNSEDGSDEELLPEEDWTVSKSSTFLTLASICEM